MTFDGVLVEDIAPSSDGWVAKSFADGNREVCLIRYPQFGEIHLSDFRSVLLLVKQWSNGEVALIHKGNWRTVGFPAFLLPPPSVPLALHSVSVGSDFQTFYVMGTDD